MRPHASHQQLRAAAVVIEGNFKFKFYFPAYLNSILICMETTAQEAQILSGVPRLVCLEMPGRIENPE